MNIHILFQAEGEEALSYLEDLELKGGPQKVYKEMLLDFRVSHNDLMKYFSETVSIEDIKEDCLNWKILDQNGYILIWNEMLGKIVFGQHN